MEVSFGYFFDFIDSFQFSEALILELTYKVFSIKFVLQERNKNACDTDS